MGVTSQHILEAKMKTFCLLLVLLQLSMSDFNVDDDNAELEKFAEANPVLDRSNMCLLFGKTRCASACGRQKCSSKCSVTCSGSKTEFTCSDIAGNSCS